MYRIYQDYDKHWVAEITEDPGFLKRIFGIKKWRHVSSSAYDSISKTDKQKVEKVLFFVGRDIADRNDREKRKYFVPVFKEFSEEDYAFGRITAKEILKNEN